MRRFPIGCLLAFLSGCYSSAFTQTVQYTPRPRPVSTVLVSTTPPPPGQFIEVGIVSANGSDFDDAVARARFEGAKQGCDALHLMSEQVVESIAGGGNSSSVYSRSRSEVRASCLVRFAASGTAQGPPPGPVTAAAPALTPSCLPECRDGFDCVGATCLSACNPPCNEGLACLGHGAQAQCVTPPAVP